MFTHSQGIFKLTKCVGENSSIFGMNTMNSEWISQDLAKDFIYGKVQVVRLWQTTPNINFTQHTIHRKYVMIEHKCVDYFAYMTVAIRNHTSNHSIQILFQDLSGWWHFLFHTLRRQRSWMTGQQCALWNWATWHASGGQQKSVSSIVREGFGWLQPCPNLQFWIHVAQKMMPQTCRWQ